MNPKTLITENQTRISFPLFCEGMSALENKDYHREIRKITVALLVLYGTAALWLLFTGGSLFFLLGESIFLGAVLFWLLVLFPTTRYRSKYKAMASNTEHIPERTTRFYTDSLTVTTDSGKDVTVPYEEISDWKETKNLYLLRCKDRLYLMLDKRGFRQGDFARVLSILSEKN